MTTSQRELERLIGAYLADGPTRIADQALEAALDAVATTGQRRPPIVPWRFAMPARMRPMLVAAAVLALAMGAVVFVGSPPPTESPVPSTSPTALPTVTPSPSAAATAIASQTTSADPRLSLAKDVVDALDRVVRPVFTSGGVTADETAFLRRVDDITGALVDGRFDGPSIGTTTAEMGTLLDALAPSMDATVVSQTRQALSALAAIAAGAYPDIHQALSRLDAAATRAISPTGLTSADQNRFLRLIDSVRAEIDDLKDLRGAQPYVARIDALVVELDAKLAGADGEAVRQAVRDLDAAVAAILSVAG